MCARAGLHESFGYGRGSYAHAAFGLKEFDGGHMYFKHSRTVGEHRNALK